MDLVLVILALIVIMFVSISNKELFKNTDKKPLLPIMSEYNINLPFPYDKHMIGKSIMKLSGLQGYFDTSFKKIYIGKHDNDDYFIIHGNIMDTKTVAAIVTIKVSNNIMYLLNIEVR
jgi:hypothetical protein